MWGSPIKHFPKQTNELQSLQGRCSGKPLPAMPAPLSECWFPSRLLYFRSNFLHIPPRRQQAMMTLPTYMGNLDGVSNSWAVTCQALPIWGMNHEMPIFAFK